MSDIVGTIFKKGVLFSLSIGHWNAIHLMKPDDLLMQQVNKKAMHLGHKRLIDPEDLNPIVNVVGKLRVFVASKSMSFPISGAAFVSFKTLKPLLKGVKELTAKFDAAVDEFVENYDSYKESQLAVLDEEAARISQRYLGGFIVGTDDWKKANEYVEGWLAAQHEQHRSLYPSKEDLRAKFYVQHRMFKIDPMGSGELSGLDAEEIAKQQEELKAELQNWVKDKAVQIHQVLGKKAQEVKESLKKKGKLSPKTLKPFFAALEEFKAVDFMDSNWRLAVDQVIEKYGGTDIDMTAQKVNADAAFADMLEGLSWLASDASAQEAAHDALSQGDFSRVVEL